MLSIDSLRVKARALAGAAVVEAYLLGKRLKRKSPLDLLFEGMEIRTTSPIIATPIKARTWGFGVELSGKAGEVKAVQVQPQCFFRLEKLMAADDSRECGHGTSIVHAYVKRKHQLLCDLSEVVGEGTSTAFFLPAVSGNDMSWDSCEAAATITFHIRFKEDCTWYGGLFGKAVL